MNSLRMRKAFISVLNGLAEVEALSSNDAFVGAQAWVTRLQTRLLRYLDLTERFAASRAAPPTAHLHALLMRVREAVASGSRSSVFSAAADLRDQVVAHFHALQEDRPGSAP